MNLYFIGGLFILHGEMTIGSLLVFMKYYEMMFTQLGAINEARHAVYRRSPRT